MTTFDGLVDSTLMYLSGFTQMQDQGTYLTAAITATDTTISMSDLTAVSRGVIEIGDELIWVDDVNQSGLVATVPPYGRGWRSTTAAAHSTGDRVTSNPLISRQLVKDSLNQAINSVYPDVFAVGSTTFTYNAAVSTYSLPAGSIDVLSVTWQTTGPSLEWIPARRYRVDSSADATAFATGASISLYDAIPPGSTVKVVYQKAPTELSASTDVFTTVTGLPASCEDVVRLGAAYRMVPFLDLPHISGNSAEADFSSNMRPAGSAATTGRYLNGLYQQRLAEESRRQVSLYPVRSHYTR